MMEKVADLKVRDAWSVVSIGTLAVAYLGEPGCHPKPIYYRYLFSG